MRGLFNVNIILSSSDSTDTTLIDDYMDTVTVG